MIITWYGQACFRVQSGPFSLVIDPFDKSIGLTPPKVEAQLTLVTHDHKDHNNTATIKGEPFVIDGPGEYEYQGVRVHGLDSFHDNTNGEERGLNTMYVIDIEGMRLVHLGDLGQDRLTETQVEALGEVDVLMLPVGGTYTIGAKHAQEIVNQVEPRIAIPMHYKVKGLTVNLAGVEEFLNEIGQKDAEPQEKLTLKRKDLQQERTEVVVMKM